MVMPGAMAQPLNMAAATTVAAVDHVLINFFMSLTP
jgi:hypothetical protein